MPSPFQTDKRALMEAVLDRQQVRFNKNHSGWQKVRCPSDAHAHGDRNPSASVNLPIGQFTCFACDLRGDGFDLMLALEGKHVRDVHAVLDGSLAPEREESEWLL